MEPHERVAQALDGRRLDLGIEWVDVAERAEITYESVRAIRKGVHRPKPLTARRLDKALEWEAGTVEALFEGRIAPDEARQVGRTPSDDDVPLTRGEFRLYIAVSQDPDAELSDAARNQLRRLGIDPDRWKKERGTR